MLRITIVDRATSRVLRLEGKLIGPWVHELATVCDGELAAGNRRILEMDDVGFADGAGLELLRQLKAAGVQLQNCSPFIAAELKHDDRVNETTRRGVDCNDSA